MNPGHQLGGKCNIKVRENEKVNEVQGRIVDHEAAFIAQVLAEPVFVKRQL